jgi:sulfoxide reductase heme-binding subunit YedZ
LLRRPCVAIARSEPHRFVNVYTEYIAVAFFSRYVIIDYIFLDRRPSRMTTPPPWTNGWRFLAIMIIVLTAMTVGVVAIRGFDENGIRMAVRYTARTSLLLFCLAFSARSVAVLWPSMLARWQLRNRRYLGLSFAASHALHAAAILAFAIVAPASFAAATSPASYVFGGIGYAFIILMAATAFDLTAAAIGPRAWRILHLVGGYYVLLQFTVSFGKRIPDMPLYTLFLLPLLAVFIMRVVAMSRSAGGALNPAAP